MKNITIENGKLTLYSNGNSYQPSINKSINLLQEHKYYIKFIFDSNKELLWKYRVRAAGTTEETIFQVDVPTYSIIYTPTENKNRVSIYFIDTSRNRNSEYILVLIGKTNYCRLDKNIAGNEPTLEKTLERMV